MERRRLALLPDFASATKNVRKSCFKARSSHKGEHPNAPLQSDGQQVTSKLDRKCNLGLCGASLRVYSQSDAVTKCGRPSVEGCEIEKRRSFRHN